MSDEQPQAAPYWKVIVAFILDFLTAFFVIGYIVGSLTGQTTQSGFQIQGGAAIVFFGILIAYFIIGGRTGGTLWRRILKIPPSPK